jgi:outer membrane protein OmpA-like peptidoglycan-associated protein
VREDFITYIQKQLCAEGIAIQVDATEGIFRFPEDLLFGSGRYDILDAGKDALTVLGEILAARLPCYSGRKGWALPAGCTDRHYHKPGKFDVILIEGHTDSQPVQSLRGGPTDNLQLSAYRSWNTYKFLTDKHQSLTGLRNADSQYLLGVSGYGENRPISPNDTPDNRKLNRRVDFRVVLAAPAPSARPVMPSDGDAGATASGAGAGAQAPAAAAQAQEAGAAAPGWGDAGAASGETSPCAVPSAPGPDPQPSAEGGKPSA